MTAPAVGQHHGIHICEMMKLLGIEPSGGEALSLSDTAALHRCETCPAEQACRDWLAAMQASAAFAPRFCPNADLFFELQANQPGPRGRH